MSNKLETSLASGPHHQLLQLVGRWKGTATTWFDGVEPVEVSDVEGEVKPLFDGRFIALSYTGSFMGKPREGLFTLGYYLKGRRYESTWIDTFHTGTGFLNSLGTPDSDAISVMGYYEAEGERWGWRTLILINGIDEFVIEDTNISPQGEKYPATRTILNRLA